MTNKDLKTTNEQIKIVKRKDISNKFLEGYMKEIGVFHLLGKAIMMLPTDLYKILSRPFRNLDYQAYTTQEKLDWYQEKSKAINNSAYVKLTDYVEAPDLKKSISKQFTSFASHKIAERVIEQAQDFSNDPKIVPVPRPKPFFGKQKKLNRPQN